MTSNGLISFRKAVAEFAPCAGGASQTRRRIMDALESDENFYRTISNGRNHWGSQYMQGWPAASPEWFRLLSVLNDEHVPGVDEEFDVFRDHIKNLLNETDTLLLNPSHVSDIWFNDSYVDAEPNTKLLPSWSYTQALAWVATKDFGIVGTIDLSVPHDPIGWLACLLSERCDKCVSGSPDSLPNCNWTSLIKHE